VSNCDACNAAVQQPGERPAPALACRLLRELDLLHTVSTALTPGGDFNVELAAFFRQLERLTGLREGLLAIVDREREKLVADALPEPGPAGKRPEAGRGEGQLGRVWADGQPRFLADAGGVAPGELSALDRLQLPSNGPAAAWLAVPIRHGSEVLGTLSFLRAPALEPVLQAELRFLVLLAGQLGLAVRFRQLARERSDAPRSVHQALEARFRQDHIPEGMTGHSSAMRAVYLHVEQVADSRTTVLIRGETGVGKERIAQAIWQGGARRNKAFIRVNCAALPEGIIESELFGHDKGAFTGALGQRKGRFELAHGGTIFLDEIGEVSPSVQAKLLRVLQEGTFERVGGHETLKVDVRVITATNRPLEEMIEQGKFRLDLYYRINVFPIYVPPLRERRSDILELADYFLEKYSELNGKKVVRLSTPAIDLLMAYHWPGNVRELENVIERAVLLSHDGVVHGYHLPPTLQTGASSGTESRGTMREAMEAVEREMIVEALKSHRGIMAKAARQLGLTERIMGLRMKKYDIDGRRFRNGDGEAA
jgi:Nif-specific regulatory protein